ncbi:MauE/DoxX family redox-associated membrane protein [Streptomyces varsoviensis]|uniref:MauE/DoxX family redox-associated membrane protein n=1 Tax=Streptomyces varsoviensis TaxID=67373 RepID=UPI0033E53EB3
MELVAVSCRTLLVVVFAVAVASKLSGAEPFNAFVRSVREFTALAPRRARAAAHLVVGTEAVGAVLLSLPRPAAAIAGFALVGCALGAFTVGMAASRRRGVRVPCRCFGASSHNTGALPLVRNGFLIVVAVTGAAGTALGGQPAAPGGLAVAAGAGLVLGVVMTVLDDIYEVLRDLLPVAAPKGHR